MVLRRLIPLLALLAILLALPASAGAVMPGENGRIVFVSGRDADNDAQAKLHLLPVPSSTGGGTVGPALAADSGQHRHPTWSPDRTRIAYARGDNATANYDIFILDLTTPNSTPMNITNSNNVTDDRPAWSPDGTRIAYESEVADGSGQSDIIVYTVATGTTLNLTSDVPGTPETKPAWSPDSQTLYYTSGDPNASAAGIYRQPATGGEVVKVLDQPAISEFQISLSPDGTRFCVTIGTGFNNTADIWTGDIESPLSGLNDLSDNGVTGDYNCTWSPDGTLIAYVTGTFSSGELVMERADDTGFPISLAQDPGANNFDGNPDWAPDGRPVCQPASALTLAGDPVSVTVNCPDQGPAYELTEVKVFRDDPPANGTATGDVQTSPATFVYTPNAGFTGTDSFKVGNFDAFGFGPDGTVTIRVLLRGNCANVQNGTNGADILTGTFAGDRLRGLRGNDRLNGEAGNDCLEGGAGNDRLNGGAGNDRLLGGRGKDTLTGGPGRNTYLAGASNDTVRARNGRREVINCGKGRDRAIVDRRDRVRGCERVTRR
jgi:Tol biopolymer transport system component